jgi:hypothetical protein
MRNIAWRIFSIPCMCGSFVLEESTKIVQEQPTTERKKNRKGNKKKRKGTLG